MWLKGVVMRAHFNGHIPRNPFAQFHISPNTKEREYLTENELKTLMEFQFKDPKNSYLRDILFCQFYCPVIRGHKGIKQRPDCGSER